MKAPRTKAIPEMIAELASRGPTAAPEDLVAVLEVEVEEPVELAPPELVALGVVEGEAEGGYAPAITLGQKGDRTRDKPM